MHRNRNLGPLPAAMHPKNERLDRMPPEPCELASCGGAKAGQHV